jgi:hypothetical protein
VDLRMAPAVKNVRGITRTTTVCGHVVSATWRYASGVVAPKTLVVVVGVQHAFLQATNNFSLAGESDIVTATGTRSNSQKDTSFGGQIIFQRS